MSNSLALVGGVLAVAMAASVPAAATTTTLDFEGAICGAGGNQVCGPGSAIGPSYGSTAQVQVSYFGVNGTNITNGAFFWNTGYGDISNVAFSGSPVLRLILSPVSNFEVRLISFDAGCYFFRTDCQNLNWSLTSLSPSSSDPVDGLVINSGTATPASSAADNVLVNSAWSATALVFDIGPHMFNGAIDNFVFESRAIGEGSGPGVVPEPASWAMLIAGFGLIGATMRRRRALTA